MMRIAQVSPTYHPYIGGIETQVKETSERIVKESLETYEVEVLTTDPVGRLPEEEEINGIKVRRFKSWAPGEAYYFSRGLKRYLVESSKNYDVVHAHNYHAFPALYASRTKGKNKLVFSPHYHGKGHTFFRSLLHVPYKLVAKRIFEKADRVVCVTRHEKDLIVKKFKIAEEKIVTIPNGVNPNEFEGLEKKRKDDGRVILYVGRLERYKGVDHLIRVMPRLDEDIRLEIVGKGPYKKALLKLLDTLEVADRVKLSHDLSRKELLQKYAEADLFLLLSKYEAFGISVAEALASGTPCIVANTSALAEWIDGKNCFGIDYPIDIGELAALVESVIGSSVKSVELPTWDEAADKLVKLYASLESVSYTHLTLPTKRIV